MTKPDEMEAEAAAILRVLDLALNQRATKSSAQYDEAKVRRGANRLFDGARVMRERGRVAG